MAAPIYKTLSQKIENYIVDNNIRGKLPGTRQLSREFGVHHVTLLKALHLLKKKGLHFKEVNSSLFLYRRLRQFQRKACKYQEIAS